MPHYSLKALFAATGGIALAILWILAIRYWSNPPRWVEWSSRPAWVDGQWKQVFCKVLSNSKGESVAISVGAMKCQTAILLIISIGLYLLVRPRMSPNVRELISVTFLLLSLLLLYVVFGASSTLGIW